MIITTYECDRCGHKQDRPEQMYDVAFGYKHVGGSSDPIRDCTRKTALWCRKCLEELNFLPHDANSSANVAAQPTMEEIFRQFVAKVAQEVVDENNS